jgi:hypothetical protein
MSDFLESQGVPEAIRGATRDLLRYDCLLLPRSEIAGEGQVSEQHAFDLDPVELAHRLAAGDEDWREVIAHPRPTILVITHRAGLAKLSGRNCDLTGSWNGRVTSRQELAERGAGGFAQEGLR